MEILYLYLYSDNIIIWIRKSCWYKLKSSSAPPLFRIEWEMFAIIPLFGNVRRTVLKKRRRRAQNTINVDTNINTLETIKITKQLFGKFLYWNLKGYQQNIIKELNRIYRYICSTGPTDNQRFWFIFDLVRQKIVLYNSQEMIWIWHYNLYNLPPPLPPR